MMRTVPAAVAAAALMALSPLAPAWAVPGTLIIGGIGINDPHGCYPVWIQGGARVENHTQVQVAEYLTGTCDLTNLGGYGPGESFHVEYGHSIKVPSV
ncbi:MULTISPECIES: hypothetical protein [Nonomuraea]|uniref:Uncharacterized protein n=1 Tax=Nonomuraea mangrovi TaxID=2316207 RepID=A0ABW4TBS4_9ACTN